MRLKTYAIQIVSLGLLIGFCGLRQHLWSW